MISDVWSRSKTGIANLKEIPTFGNTLQRLQARKDHGKWILNGKCLIFSGTMVMEDQTTWIDLGIMRIDPATNNVESWEVTSLGETSDMPYDNSAMTMSCANTQSNEGKYFAEGTFTANRGTLIYRFKIGKEGEEPLPYGWTLVLAA